MVKAIAPGKLILSGEHAVVHGQPALAMAINRFSETTILPQASGRVIFNAGNLRQQDSLTWQALRKLKRRLQRNYEHFLQGRLAIRDVLKKPLELTQFAVTHLLESLHEQIHGGFQVQTQSTIPIGCGMGSSAATILSVIYAFGNFLQLDWDRQRYYQQALAIENLQHGYSSGLDLNISQQGGLLWYQNGKSEARELPKLNWYIVNTGKPLSTTGECVTYTSKKLNFASSLLLEFGKVTRELDIAIQQQCFEAIQRAIQENHRLLCILGVVPAEIQTFISALENHQAAAKICGAGTLIGQKAGIVLILSKTNPTPVCEQFGFSCMQIQGETNGLRII